MNRPASRQGTSAIPLPLFHTENYINYPRIHVGMATKNISITEGAYRRLASLRRGGESFSGIINRITQARDIMQFAGILSKNTADRMEGRIAEQRSRYDRNLKARISKRGELVP